MGQDILDISSIYRSKLESVPLKIVYFDDNGNLIACTKSVKLLFNIFLEEINQNDPYNIFEDELLLQNGWLPLIKESINKKRTILPPVVFFPTVNEKTIFKPNCVVTVHGLILTDEGTFLPPNIHILILNELIDDCYINYYNYEFDKFLEIQKEVLKALLTKNDPYEIYKDIFNIIIKGINSNMGILALVGNDFLLKEEIITTNGQKKSNYQKINISFNELSDNIPLRKEYILYRDSSRIPEKLKQLGFKDVVIIFPIVYKSHWMGLIALNTQFNNYSYNDLTFLTRMSNILANFAISNNYLTIKWKDIAVKNLKRENEELLRVLKIANIIVVETDIDGYITNVNDIVSKTIGYDVIELIGRRWVDIFVKEELKEWVVKKLEELSSIDSNVDNVKFNSRLITKDGRELIFSWITTAVINNLSEKVEFLFIGKDITDKTKVEKRIDWSEVRYKNLFNMSPVSLIEVDLIKVKPLMEKIYQEVTSGNFHEYFNKNFEPLLEIIDNIQIIGVNEKALQLFKVKTKPEFDTIFKENIRNFKKELLINLISSIMEKNISTSIETTIFNALNEELTVYFHVSVIEREFDVFYFSSIVSILDITELKSTEKELETKKNYLAQKVQMATRDLIEKRKQIEKIIETISDGIIVLDISGSVIHVNKTFEKFYQKIFDRPFPKKFNIYDHSDELLIREIINKIDSKVHRLEHQVIEPKEGFYLQIRVANIDLPGEFTNNIGTVIELKDVTTFIEYSNLRKQFISTVSHELRTPITNINLSINILKKYRQQLEDSEMEEIISRIAQNSNILNQMINDLLLVSRIEDRRFKLDYKSVYIYEMIMRVIEQLKQMILVKRIKVSVSCDTNVNIMADPVRIEQILRILFSNAIKYSENDKEIYIKVVPDYKGKRNPFNQKGILIIVKDQGIGIKKKYIKHLFERFYRVPDIRNKYQGTGLGLSIAKELVVLHKGSISMKSIYGKGSSFFVFLPYSVE